MGETADKTRSEIVQLRAEMSEKVVDLRRAAERPVRMAKVAAAGAAALVVVVGAAMLVRRARQRQASEHLQARVRSDVPKETHRPLHEKVLESAARAAATAAVGYALKSLQDSESRSRDKPSERDRT
jgi:hypothetical protein